MTPATYITDCLKHLQLKETPIFSGPLNDEIYRLLLSKKFRKYAVNPEYCTHIRTAIDTSVAKNEPVKLTLVFGGYKLWRLKESPEPDWAELFAFMYYAHWLRPICAVYKPGVWLDFYSDDVILEAMDNVPKKDTNAYILAFRVLLAFIKPYLPDNLSITLHRVADQYASYDDFLKELDGNKVTVQKELGGLPKLTDEQRRLVELNVHLKPGQDADPLWREKVFLTHEAYARVSRRRPYYRTPEKIFVITRPIKDSIAVGTAKTSVVKFWIGAGALERKDDSYIQHIFSPHQLTERTFEAVPIHIEGLSGKNFSAIRVTQP